MIKWGMAVQETVKAFNSGVKFNGINNILKHVKAGTVGDIKVTISGARGAVEDLFKLSTGPKTKLIKALKKSVGIQINKVIGMNWGFASIVFDIGVDVLTSFSQYMAGMITCVQFVSQSLGSVVYNIIRTASSILLRTVLLPFVGAFTWLITLVIDIGIDVINWVVDLKREVSKMIEWVLNQSWDTAYTFVKQIRKLI